VTSTLYDFLGVRRDADATEIRTTWRTLIADLDPSDPRFRAYNEAAETLLDPARRSAYDATLEPSAPEPAEPVEPVEPVGADEPAPDTEQQDPEPTTAVTSLRRGMPLVPGWVLAVVAVITALAVTAVVLLGAQPSEGSIESASTDAKVAAQTAIEPILSYDYRTLDQDQNDAHRYLTSGYKAEYDKAFNDLIRPNASSTKTVVTVKVIDAAIVRTSGDDMVQVLLFVNRPTSNKARTVVYKDQVTVTMVKEDGHWLVDKLSTTPLGA
jgi:Mce-associated membrane protein